MKLKNTGVGQLVVLKFSPTVYNFDNVEHYLTFKQQLEETDILQVIYELGKEVSLIKQVRAINATTKAEAAVREYAYICELEKDLISICTNIAEHVQGIKHGSGMITCGHTCIKFRKPKLLGFKE